MDSPQPNRALLHILTADPQPPDNLVAAITMPKACDGSMLCECDNCQREREYRVRRGVRTTRQPWNGRKAA